MKNSKLWPVALHIIITVKGNDDKMKTYKTNVAVA